MFCFSWTLLFKIGVLCSVLGISGAIDQDIYSSYVNLMPRSPNAAVGEPKSLYCSLHPLLDRLAKTVRMNNKRVVLNYTRMINETTARYDLVTGSVNGAWRASTIIDKPGTSSVSCARRKRDPVVVVCDLSFVIQQLASHVRLTVDWSRDSRRTINKYVQIKSSAVEFQLTSVPHVAEGRANVCCHIALDLPMPGWLNSRSSANNCQPLHVGYLPPTPMINENDIIINDLVSLSFRWTALSNDGDTEHVASYMMLDHSAFTAYLQNDASWVRPDFRVCAEDRTQPLTCTLDSSLFEPAAAAYVIKAESRNDFGQTASEEMVVETIKFVIPSAVQHLHIVSRGATSVELGWRHSLASHLLTFTITITCVDEATICDNVPEPARFQGDGLVTVNVSSLHAHTRYNVSVSAQLSVKDKRTRPGRVTFMSLRTHASVPSAAPLTCAGCFSLSTSDNARMITVYWKQIPRHEQKNDIVRYRLQVTGDGGGLIGAVDTPDGCATSAVVDSSSLSTDVTLSVTIAGVVIVNNNVELLSDSAAVVVRTSQQNRISASQLTITVVSSSNQMTNEVMWTKVQGAVDYTVVWCRRRTGSAENNICKGEISWRHVTTTSSVLLPITNFDLVDIMIGVSVNMGTHHTGIIWSECSQFDSQEKSIVEVMDSELPVRLRILPAQCMQNSREYTVEYCSADVGNSDCTELHIGRLTGIVLQLPFVEVELHGARPGQNYTIVVYSNSSPFRPSAAFVAQVELPADGYSITSSRGTIAVVVAVVLLLVVLLAIFAVLHLSTLTAKCVRYLKRGCLEDFTPPSPKPAVIANDRVDEFVAAEAGFIDFEVYEDDVLRISVKDIDAACQILLPGETEAQSTESTELSHLLTPEVDNDAISTQSSSSSGDHAKVGYCRKTGYAGERQDATSNDTSVTSSLNTNTQPNVITHVDVPLQYEGTIQALPSNNHINSLSTAASLTANEQQAIEEAANGTDDNGGDDNEEQSNSQSSFTSGFMVAYARPVWAVNSGDGSRSRSASSQQHDEESQSVSSANAVASDHNMTDNYAAMAWVGGNDMPSNASIDDEGSDEELTCPYATAVSDVPTDGYAFLTRLHPNASEDDDDQFNEQEPAYATAGRFACLNNVSQNVDMSVSLDDVSNVVRQGQSETDATNDVVQCSGSRDDSSVSVVPLHGTNTNESNVDLSVQCSSPNKRDSNEDLSLQPTSVITRENDVNVCDSISEKADDFEQYSDSGGSFCAYAHTVY